ncbi:MAG: sn-glycerol-1-phosphate dehydrogenase [Ruminococcaceae bacterium]|nr:sn-glycerol-1-phosphate dehydrogenase [Oscillospiraceae bacterium]
MNIQQLLQGTDCSCGKHHTCDIQFVAIEKGAISHLTHLTEGYKSVLLVADENTYGVGGAKTEVALGERLAKKVIFSGKTILIPNEDAVAAVDKEMSGIDLIVGLGSGVIQDLCKYVSQTSGIPYFIVATAPSMDGYASTGAAMIMGGMKITYPAHVPSVILADTEILKDAPMEMIQAGYGDIVGKFSALNDWKLSHIVGGEDFCQENYDLIEEMLKKTLSLADGLVNRDEESVRVLMEALVIVGIAMAFVGSSRPASGSEHHLSHYFEIVGILRNEDYFCHGIDVAYSTVVTAALREEILSKPWPDSQFRLSRAEYEAEIKRIYGSVAEGCIALQDKVGLYGKDMLSIYKAREAQIRACLAEVPKASEIEAMLTAVGMDMSDFYKLYSKEKIADAILYAKELKDRYTVLWLYYDLFGSKQ